jgi:geranylgeranyl reductase family protein
MKHHEPVDVAIVGAGPAGAWAAWRLARAGAGVVLLDPSHPREKPCGGGVTGRALALIAPAVTLASAGVRIRTARFVDANGAAAEVPLSPAGRDLMVVSRAVFDAALAAAAQDAGAALLAERVSDVQTTADGIELRTAANRTISARIVIGADGANSFVRRRLSGAFRRTQLSLATGFYAHGATSDEVVIEFVADPPGYIWSFPRPDHLAIGMCAQADGGLTPEQLRRNVTAWIGRSRVVPPGAPLEAYSWPIPSLRASELSHAEFAGPGWMLAGDAAGLVDPITREGIFFALKSADHAATAILEASEAPHVRYQALVEREIVPELVRAARLKAGFFRPQFTRLLVHALACSPAVAGIMADLAAGTQTYAGLKWKLLSTMEWRLAWRLLRLERGPSPAVADHLAR